jgi:ketosteroid isomerase-like protein
MASANVELVRSIYADWERGDFGSAEWAHPNIELVIADGPEPGAWTQLHGLAEGMRGILNVWEGFRVEADEYRECDAEHVIVLAHPIGRGKTSGMELGQMDLKGAQLFQLRFGKVTKLVHYYDRDRALADLGLASEGDVS